MDLDSSAPAGSRRGRVVMLVDNGVQGDSRVEKTARSAAEAGWEVILLGVLGGTSSTDQWHLGGAEVRLLRVPRSLGQHPIQFRRSWRRPLAYPPGRMAGYRVQSVKAWQADLAARRAKLAAARVRSGARGRELMGTSLQIPARTVAKALGLWTRFRASELTKLRRQQQNPDSPLTKLSISFWQKLMGPRSWRRLDRGLWDYDLAFGRVIDQLRPDIIHAHDFRMLGVGARATVRAQAHGRGTKLVWDAHEFVAGVLGRDDNPRWLPAQVAYVEEYASYADAVVTVSPTLAELLQETHRLPQRPAVVLNAPVRTLGGAYADAPPPDLRALCGISAQTPLLVYCGGVNPVRGVDLMIDALPSLPDVHIALVTLHPSGRNAQSDGLRARADELGVTDRVHLLPYVAHWQVSAFLSAANVGVVPILHKPNHELALITKFFEYSHARLPLVVSDVRAMAETTRATGQGEVFRAGDVADYVRAVKLVLADPGKYTAAYERSELLGNWTWEKQAEILEGVYRRLRPDLTRAGPAPEVAMELAATLRETMGEPVGQPSAEPATAAQ